MLRDAVRRGHRPGRPEPQPHPGRRPRRPGPHGPRPRVCGGGAGPGAHRPRLHRERGRGGRQARGGRARTPGPARRRRPRHASRSPSTSTPRASTSSSWRTSWSTCASLAACSRRPSACSRTAAGSCCPCPNVAHGVRAARPAAGQLALHRDRAAGRAPTCTSSPARASWGFSTRSVSASRSSAPRSLTRWRSEVDVDGERLPADDHRVGPAPAGRPRLPVRRQRRSCRRPARSARPRCSTRRSRTTSPGSTTGGPSRCVPSRRPGTGCSPHATT